MRVLAACSILFLTACGPESPRASVSPSRDCVLSADRIGSFATLPAGSFLKGRDAVYREELPEIDLHVAGFAIQTHEVTNAQFAAFVAATGYLTDAEQSSASTRPDGGSAVFGMPDSSGAPGLWRLQRGATWRTPLGPGSSISGEENLPVVHVSLRDARAYAAWAGGRLPKEEEWEYAAATGMRDPSDRISGARGADGEPAANTWQGVFPVLDVADDGFRGAAPVGCFAADRNGLHDMIGNVWEWTDTPFGAGTHTIKGGSFLCAENFCRRYRASARQPQEDDFSSNHIGFRIIKDVGVGKTPNPKDQFGQ